MSPKCGLNILQDTVNILQDTVNILQDTVKYDYIQRLNI